MNTKIEKAMKLYDGMISRTKQNNLEEIRFSRDEFITWLYALPEYHELYSGWESSEFESNKAPSIDRINSSLSYSFNNMQLITWEANRDKRDLVDHPKRSGRNGEEVPKYISYDPIRDLYKVDYKKKAKGEYNSLDEAKLLLERFIKGYVPKRKWDDIPKGIIFDKRTEKWQVVINHKSKSFNTLEEAKTFKECNKEIPKRKLPRYIYSIKDKFKVKLPSLGSKTFNTLEEAIEFKEQNKDL